jgi:hypothetical protein
MAPVIPLSKATMQLPIPMCHSAPWPADLKAATEKFDVYNERMRLLFKNRDRTAEYPRINIWSMGPAEPALSSACLQWDVLHVYHMMAILHWNEAVTQFSTARDHNKARLLFTEAAKYFKAISDKVLPSWLPACRSAQRHEKDGSLTLVFPSFLVSDTWKHWTTLATSMVYRVMIDKAIAGESSPSLVSKLALGGYRLLASLPRTELKNVQKLVEEQRNVLKIYGLVYWSRIGDSSAEGDIHGRRVKILKDLAQTPVVLPGIDDLRKEAELYEQTNNTVYFHPVPSGNVADEVLASAPATAIIKEENLAMICCV